jgi:hypothetical protein
MNNFQIAPVPRFTMSRKKGDPLSVEFSPPLGSDALFHALSHKYPEIKTHQLRLQKAAIEFHLSEFEQESRLCDGSHQNMLPPLPKSALRSPWRPVPQASSPSRAPVGGQFNLDSGTILDTTQFHSMLGGFEKNPGPHKAHVKKPMSQKDREEYKVVKSVGACEKHRKQKKRVSFTTPCAKQKLIF